MRIPGGSVEWIAAEEDFGIVVGGTDASCLDCLAFEEDAEKDLGGAVVLGGRLLAESPESSSISCCRYSGAGLVNIEARVRAHHSLCSTESSGIPSKSWKEKARTRRIFNIAKVKTASADKVGRRLALEAVSTGLGTPCIKPNCLAKH